MTEARWQVAVLPIAAIRCDGNTQTRAQIDMLTAQEYADAIRGGADLPPVTVYHDGMDYWLAGGFHRLEAHKRLGFIEIAASVHSGTRQDAVWAALAENLTHGLRRTNADKRRAVEVALGEFPGKSDHAIAEQCGVSQPFVSALRAEHEPTNNGYQSDVRTGRDGRTINTANIGRKPELDSLRAFDDEDSRPREPMRLQFARDPYPVGPSLTDEARGFRPAFPADEPAPSEPLPAYRRAEPAHTWLMDTVEFFEERLPAEELARNLAENPLGSSVRSSWLHTIARTRAVLDRLEHALLSNAIEVTHR